MVGPEDLTDQVVVWRAELASGGEPALPELVFEVAVAALDQVRLVGERGWPWGCLSKALSRKVFTGVARVADVVQDISLIDQ